MTIEEAADALAALIQEGFDELKLSPAERKRRTIYAHNRLAERLLIDKAKKQRRFYGDEKSK